MMNPSLKLNTAPFVTCVQIVVTANQDFFFVLQIPKKYIYIH